MLRCIAIWICMFSAMASAGECVDDKDDCTGGTGCPGIADLCDNNEVEDCCPVTCGVCVPDATEPQNGECTDDFNDCSEGMGCKNVDALCGIDNVRKCCMIACGVCVPDAIEPPPEPPTELQNETPTEPEPTCACDADAVKKEIEDLEAQLACVEPKKWDDVTKTCEAVACVYNDHGARSRGKLTLDQIVRVNGKKKTSLDSAEECHDFCKEYAAPDADAFTFKNWQWCICKSAGKDFEFVPKVGRDSGFLVDTFSPTSCTED